MYQNYSPFPQFTVIRHEYETLFEQTSIKESNAWFTILFTKS